LKQTNTATCRTDFHQGRQHDNGQSDMASSSHHHRHPVTNDSGGVAGILITLVLVLALAGGGGFWAYNKYFKKEPLRTKLASTKVKDELVQFTHDYVSRALYRNLMTLDDILVMMDKELKRLKRIGTKFPDQSNIITTQTKELGIARNNLVKTMSEVIAKLEKMYVIWLVDRTKGISQINSQKGTLTRQLADAIRDEAVLIGRIRSNPEAAS
jgi:hypothetical protein